MNKWKIAFWVCFTTLILVAAFGMYCIIDQGVTLTYMKDSCEETENDLDNISKIINETDLTKFQVKKTLISHHLFEFMDFNKDTVSLDRVSLIFKDDKLFKIANE